MAEENNKGKLDLRARLGLRKSSTPVVDQPLIPGAPPPKPVETGPTEESIAEARRLAEEAALEAGPAAEDFQFGTPDKTPIPAALPTAPRVEYVEVDGVEELAGAKKQRFILLAIVAVLALGFGYLVGQISGESAANTKIREGALLEADEKKKLFSAEATVETFDLIRDLRENLEKVDSLARNLDPETGKITDLKEDMNALLEQLIRFSNHDRAALDPATLTAGTSVSGELVKAVLAVTYRTQALHAAVQNTVQEIRALMVANPIPDEGRQKLNVVAESDLLSLEGVGDIPLSKGTLVIESGPPAEMDGGTPDQPLYNQVVRLEGRDKPIQILTQQFVVVDMAPFWEKRKTLADEVVYTRMRSRVSELLELASDIDRKGALEAIDDVLNPGAAE